MYSAENFYYLRQFMINYNKYVYYFQYTKQTIFLELSPPEPHPLISPAPRCGVLWREAFPAVWAALFPETESPPASGSPE